MTDGSAGAFDLSAFCRDPEILGLPGEAQILVLRIVELCQSQGFAPADPVLLGGMIHTSFRRILKFLPDLIGRFFLHRGLKLFLANKARWTANGIAPTVSDSYHASPQVHPRSTPDEPQDTANGIAPTESASCGVSPQVHPGLTPGEPQVTEPAAADSCGGGRGGSTVQVLLNEKEVPSSPLAGLKRQRIRPKKAPVARSVVVDLADPAKVFLLEKWDASMDRWVQLARERWPINQLRRFKDGSVSRIMGGSFHQTRYRWAQIMLMDPTITPRHLCGCAFDYMAGEEKVWKAGANFAPKDFTTFFGEDEQRFRDHLGKVSASIARSPMNDDEAYEVMRGLLPKTVRTPAKSDTDRLNEILAKQDAMYGGPKLPLFEEPDWAGSQVVNHG